MQRVLVVDVGGSHVKVLVTGQQVPRRAESGPKMTAAQMVDVAKRLAEGWDWDVVAVGIPSPLHGGRVASDPVNLGKGWAGFDFEAAFGKPTRISNDAAMQALGSYDGVGRMLFLGFGTGLGSALVDGGVVEPMELAHLPFRKGTIEDYVGEAGLKRLGKERWRRRVLETIELLSAALEPDYVVLGGGNAKKVGELPPNVRLGDNANAFVGGFRLWETATVDASQQSAMPTRPT
jgi:polyphosphate glucokinase